VTAVELAFPTAGRVARSKISVRPSQIRRGGIAKLTDVAAALLDASFDDLVAINGGWIPGKALIVRANVVDVWVAPRINEELDVEVACGGLARHWLEHRVRATGTRGAHVELSTSWALIDIATGRPSPLPDAIADGYADAVGRRPRPVPRIPGPPADVERRPWPVRADDLDGNDHVNNAAYFSVVAEVLEARPVTLPHRISILYRAELTWPSVPDLVWSAASVPSEGAAGEPPVEAWLVGEEAVHTAIRVIPLDAADRPPVTAADEGSGQPTT
jgi:acyl-CoA thioesterase FadM